MTASNRAARSAGPLEDHPDEKTISLLAISVSHLEKHWDVQLKLPLGLEDEKRLPRAVFTCHVGNHFRVEQNLVFGGACEVNAPAGKQFPPCNPGRQRVPRAHR